MGIGIILFVVTGLFLAFYTGIKVQEEKEDTLEEEIQQLRDEIEEVRERYERNDIR